MLFIRETLTTNQEFTDLFKAHFNELRMYKDFPFDPDFESFKKIEAAGKLRVFTAWENGFVGYDIFILSNNVFSSKVQIATEVCIYLKPEKRGKWGSKFIDWVDGQLTSECGLIYRAVSEEKDYSLLLKKKRYNKKTSIFLKETQWTRPRLESFP